MNSFSNSTRLQTPSSSQTVFEACRRAPMMLAIALAFSLSIFALPIYSPLLAQGLDLSSFPAPITDLPVLNVPPPPLQPSDIGGSVQNIPETFDVPGTEAVEIVETNPPSYWYNPLNWLRWEGWTNTAELGLNGSAGNSDSFAFQVGFRMLRETDISKIDIKLTHNRTNANGIETQNNSLFFLDYDRLRNESKWSYFGKFGLEADEFRAFDLRLNLNGGLTYNWFSTDDLTLKTRFGSGVSREFGGPDDAVIPEAVFGFTYEHQLNSRHKLLAKVDYFPDWADFANYRIVAHAGWEYLLDEEGNLSLKLGANNRYDSTPNGLNPNDINYNALLLYKF